MDETLKAIQETKEEKSLGICGIPAEVWKHGEKVKKKLHNLIESIWEKELSLIHI